MKGGKLGLTQRGGATDTRADIRSISQEGSVKRSVNEEATGITYIEDEKNAVSKILSLTEIEKMPLNSSINRIPKNLLTLLDGNTR